MASRRDELNAYVFAKRRLVAQFLRPTSTGSDEGAPRPLRAVLPGVLAGAVGLAGFGVWGLLSPAAPPGWQAPYANVIVANPSTTRYVVLRTNGKAQLHPVLNMASARLLVDTQGRRGQLVIRVADRLIDEEEKLPRGPAVGIPYAPDRLPSRREATTPKRWAACDRPVPRGEDVRTAVFVFSARDEGKLKRPRLLHGGQLLYVRSTAEGGGHHVVDATGTAYPIDHTDGLLLRLVVGSGRAPQPVSREWLDTLHAGSRITMPPVPGATRPSRVRQLPPQARRIGTVLQAREGGKRQRYVVLADRIAPVTDFVAALLLGSDALRAIPQTEPIAARIPSTGAWFRPYGKGRWPDLAPAARPASATVCSVLHSVDRATGRTTLGVWSGPGFPRPLPGPTTPSYVTPGSGQLYRQFTGDRTDVGPVFLATDAGFRHSIQTRGGAEPGDTGHRDGPDPAAKGAAKAAVDLLGYSDASYIPVPRAWSSLLPTGPRLSTGAAVQVQGP
ncbi:type VII secretion protein EccB [Streptomyces sp. NPDC088745]|uniref:type VII secretion protein EccB n=1 Tax=Streptomyces sp. NPDC088745 TaxID=3365884 RepID=UPI003822F46A